jgi:hypothetical protein
MFKGSGEKVRVGQSRGRSGPHHRELILSKNLATHHKEVLIIVFFVHVASYAASIAVIMFIFSQAISPLQISSPPSISADYLHDPERKTCSMADACVPHQYAMHNSSYSRLQGLYRTAGCQLRWDKHAYYRCVVPYTFNRF